MPRHYAEHLQCMLWTRPERAYCSRAPEPTRWPPRPWPALQHHATRSPPHRRRRRAPPRLHPPCSRRCNCRTTASSYQPWRPWEKLSTTTPKPVQGTPYSRTRYNRLQLKPPSRPEGGAADGLVAAPQSPNPSRRSPTRPLQLRAGSSGTKLLPRLPSSPSRKPWAPPAWG